MLPDLVRVRHMLDAAREVSSFVQGRSREHLDSNRMLVLSLVKSIENFGEAASRVSPELQRAYPEIPWRDAVSMRNRLVHGYFDIDLDIVWETATEELSALVPLLEQIVRDESNP